MAIDINDVKVIKLISGEELIGSVSTDMNTGDITVSYPITTHPTAESSIVFIPFCAAAHTEAVKFKQDRLICDPLPIQEEMFKQYAMIVEQSQQVSEPESPIAVPNNDIIIP